jgi:hypothetical protein
MGWGQPPFSSSMDKYKIFAAYSFTLKHLMPEILILGSIIF